MNIWKQKCQIFIILFSMITISMISLTVKFMMVMILFIICLVFGDFVNVDGGGRLDRVHEGFV